MNAVDEIRDADVTKPVYFLRSKKYGNEYLIGKSWGCCRSLALEIGKWFAWRGR